MVELHTLNIQRCCEDTTLYRCHIFRLCRVFSPDNTDKLGNTMKIYELKAIAKRLNDFSFISRARRVEDNTLELVFDKIYEILKEHNISVDELMD